MSLSLSHLYPGSGVMLDCIFAPASLIKIVFVSININRHGLEVETGSTRSDRSPPSQTY